ncbi:unnamed protein product [Paramecium octaurelia]|uniref:PH domain-containing protein n=1 Tax=Paramecium octaurelia TaxID=43137 RepID=A0A8S1U4X2_PAROT|nr:unnamed protein product [Paramecium octaurelia]
MQQQIQSAITSPYGDQLNNPTFKHSSSIVIGRQKTQDQNPLRMSLMASVNDRLVQMQQMNQKDVKPNEIIEEVQVEFEGIQNIDYRLAQSVISQDVENETSEADILQQSKILESGLFQCKQPDSYSGWIEKKSNSLFSSYKNKFCVFHDGILCVYENEERKRARVVLNFHLFNFKYFFKQSNNVITEFGLKCEDDEAVFQFKGQHAHDWFQVIKNCIDTYRLNPKFQYYIRPFEEYYKKRLIHNQQFLDMAQTGDILLFQGKHISCKAQRMVTRSQYDHVAMILKYTNGSIYVLEATGTFGVGIFEWKHMAGKQWYELYNKVVYRQLEIQRTTDFLLKMEQFTKENLGKAYSLTVKKILTDKSVMITSSEKNTYFCSQLVAQAYKKTGILQTELSATQFWPGSFSNEKQDLELTNAKLSDEYLIGFNM